MDCDVDDVWEAPESRDLTRSEHCQVEGRCRNIYLPNVIVNGTEIDVTTRQLTLDLSDHRVIVGRVVSRDGRDLNMFESVSPEQPDHR